MNTLQVLAFSSTQKWDRTVRQVLALMHVTGIIGLQIPFTEPLFRALVPFHLLVSCLIILFFQKDQSRSFWFFCMLIFLLGFFIEVEGVATGQVFGSYQYGATLGWKLWHTPLLIGINWLMLTLGANALTQQLIPHYPLAIRIILAALSMVLLDALLEPVAVRFQFWHWARNRIPTQNYVSWGICSLLFSCFFHWFKFSHFNTMAAWVFQLQVIFFLVLRIFLAL